jgi:peptidyl-tRNA hydrolase, PTH1 family
MKISKDTEQITIIYGLGNNDEKLLKTKHNMGRLLVEKIAKQLEPNTNFKLVKEIWILKSQNIWFCYSNGYMNLSGQSLNSFLSYLKVKQEDIQMIIVQDDSDQLEGKYKIVKTIEKGGRSAGGHNGIIDIQRYFSFPKGDVSRVKLGIRREGDTTKAIDFVLKPISKLDELLLVEKILEV